MPKCICKKPDAPGQPIVHFWFSKSRSGGQKCRDHRCDQYGPKKKHHHVAKSIKRETVSQDRLQRNRGHKDLGAIGSIEYYRTLCWEPCLRGRGEVARRHRKKVDPPAPSICQEQRCENKSIGRPKGCDVIRRRAQRQPQSRPKIEGNTNQNGNQYLPKAHGGCLHVTMHDTNSLVCRRVNILDLSYTSVLDGSKI